MVDRGGPRHSLGCDMIKIFNLSLDPGLFSSLFPIRDVLPCGEAQSGSCTAICRRPRFMTMLSPYCPGQWLMPSLARLASNDRTSHRAKCGMYLSALTKCWSRARLSNMCWEAQYCKAEIEPSRAESHWDLLVLWMLYVPYRQRPFYCWLLTTSHCETCLSGNYLLFSY